MSDKIKIGDYTFTVKRLTVGQSAQVAQLLDGAADQQKGLLGIIGNAMAKFDAFAKIIFAGQEGVDAIDFNNQPVEKFEEVLTAFKKKNPKILEYASSWLKNLGLSVAELQTTYKKATGAS